MNPDYGVKSPFWGTNPKYFTFRKWHSNGFFLGITVDKYKYPHPYATKAGRPPRFATSICYGKNTLEIRWGCKHDTHF